MGVIRKIEKLVFLESGRANFDEPKIYYGSSRENVM